jgi:hypothetical protein
MSDTTFDRETLLDLSVNVVPLAIILFFAALIVVFDPFSEGGDDEVYRGADRRNPAQVQSEQQEIDLWIRRFD